MAAKEKLSMLEKERTKKEKEKIQAERKRKAAQFLASMKIIPSFNKISNNTPCGVKTETNNTNSRSSNILLLYLFHFGDYI